MAGKQDKQSQRGKSNAKAKRKSGAPQQRARKPRAPEGTANSGQNRGNREKIDVFKLSPEAFVLHQVKSELLTGIKNLTTMNNIPEYARTLEKYLEDGYEFPINQDLAAVYFRYVEAESEYKAFVQAVRAKRQSKPIAKTSLLAKMLGDERVSQAHKANKAVPDHFSPLTQKEKTPAGAGDDGADQDMDTDSVGPGQGNATDVTLYDHGQPSLAKKRKLAGDQETE